MKKIPTLFVRKFENHKVVEITDEVTKGMEWVLRGEGVATIKWDGSCCAIINGELYKRYDAKKGKKPPAGAIPCQDKPDPITGHFPHWIKCSRDNPADCWFWAAYDDVRLKGLCPDGTYEAIGEHFQGNPYGLAFDTLVKHGEAEINEDLTTFEKIKEFLTAHEIEGIVFWRDGEPKCKIKRSDFGLKWGSQK
jgi:hypothetical protein